ncbi:hypothetical protein LCGC14_1202090 [marine sediment metagenome]|uniref:Uncharacterized protein n=1 Tax=marine sediment metagenome TaxID=412755 RepID=A0A0F9PLB8_9ZZZZ
MPVETKKIGGKWRVVEANTGKLAKRNGRAVDGGGHGSEGKAVAQVQAINISLHERKK